MKEHLYEIQRVRELMGITNFIFEKNYTKKYLLKEDKSPFAQYMDELAIAFGKKGGHTEKEIKMLDDILQRYNDEFGGDFRYMNGLDDATRRVLADLLSSGSDFTSRIFYPAYKKSLTKTLADDAYRIISTDRVLFDMMNNTKLPPNMVRADGSIPSYWEYMSTIYNNGSEISDLVKDGLIPLGVLSQLRDGFDKLSLDMMDDAPGVSKFLEDLIDQIDEIEGTNFNRSTPPVEFVDEITSYQSKLLDAIEDPKDIVDIPVAPTFDDFTFGPIADALDETEEGLEKRALDALISDMEKKCKKGFCKTMIAYYKTDTATFKKMWSLMSDELRNRIKPKFIDTATNSIPLSKVEELKLIVERFEKDNQTPFTPADYRDLGEKIYDTMKKNDELGIFGSNLPYLKDFGILTKKEMVYKILGYVAVGSDLMTGKWTWSDMVQRWWRVNAVVFGMVLIYRIADLSLGSESPDESMMDSLLALVQDTAMDTLFIGMAPGVRLAAQGIMEYLGSKFEGATYVDEKQLVKYLEKEKGLDNLGIYEYIINAGKVTYLRDGSPPKTTVKGVTQEPYNIANGDYQIINKRLSGKIFNPKVTFKPEGEISPDQSKLQKKEEVPKSNIKPVEDLLKTDSFLTEYIKTRGQNIPGQPNLGKVLDYDRQEKQTNDGVDYNILIFEFTNVSEGNYEAFFNYTLWVQDSKPSIKEQTAFDKYCKLKEKI